MTELQPSRIPPDSRWSQISSALIFLALALGLVVPHALDAAIVILGLMAISWLTVHGRAPHQLAALERLFLAAILLFVVAWLIAWLAHGLPPGNKAAAHRHLKLLAIPFLYLYLRRMDGLAPAWWRGLVAGALLAGTYALWFSLSGRSSAFGWRVPGPTNPIYFGGFALAYALMLIPRLASSGLPGWKRSLVAVAVVLAFVANALSGSRGAWLAIPAVLVIYLFTAGARQPLRWRLGLPALILALSSIVLVNPFLPMSDRLDETMSELAILASGQQAGGGIGLRLQLWAVAGEQIHLHPLTGSGPGSFPDAVQQWVQRGLGGEELLPYDHPHNQYLSALIDGGIGLLLCLVLLMTAPALAVSSMSRSRPGSCRHLAWCVLAASMVLLVMALSESLFERTAGISWFVFLIAVTTALARAQPAPQSG